MEKTYTEIMLSLLEKYPHNIIRTTPNKTSGGIIEVLDNPTEQEQKELDNCIAKNLPWKTTNRVLASFKYRD